MEFNWEGFEQNKFVVHCKTKEEASDFLNECEKRGFVVSSLMKKGGCKFHVFGEETAYRYDKISSINYGTKSYYEENDYSIVKWQIKGQTKTISGVLENIQEGEIYQAIGSRYIQYKDGKIVVGTDTHTISFYPNEIFKKMKEVDFITALEYMKKGGEATCLTENESYKVVDGQIRHTIFFAEEFHLSLKQIESKWLIEE